MIILFLLLFLPAIIYGDSTGTIMIPLTTYQLLLEGFDLIENKEDKIAEIGKELTKNPDIITGQSLTNLKAYLEVEVKHEKQGRNYFGFISYPVYIKKE